MSNTSAVDPLGTTDIPSPPPSIPEEKDDPHAKRSFTAKSLQERSWVRNADYVQHRVRGILLTEDTYPLFRLSFESDRAARLFLGELLVSMSASKRFIRMTELQLEDMNASWSEFARPTDPQFVPTELTVTMAYETTYEISSQAEIVKTLYYVALSKMYIMKLIEDAICNRELNGLWNKSSQAPAASQTRCLPHTEQQRSIEDELNMAIKFSKLPDKAKANTVPGIVERMVGVTKVGCRERSEPFLHLSEVRRLRLLPRCGMHSAGKAIKFVYWEKDEECRITYTIRAFLTRRLVGAIDKSKMDELMAQALRESDKLTNVLERGDAAPSHLDAVAERILCLAIGSRPAADKIGLVDSMFSSSTSDHGTSECTSQ